MTTATKSHTHKVKRLRYKNGETVFFCTKDNCHYKINVELSLGKRVECWRCGKPFELTVATKRMDKPHCSDCTKRRGNQPKMEFDLRRIDTSLPKEAIDNVSDLRARLQKSILRSIADVSSVNDSDKSHHDDEDDML